MPWVLRWFGLGRLTQFLVCLFVILLQATTAFAADVPPLEGRLNDRAQILSTGMRQQLSTRLEAYERATGHQLAVLTIPTLDGDPIEDFGIRVVEAWKLGKKGTDDGILLLVVSKDRKMRIEVGYGLEGTLPDAAAGRIIREVMTPYFKRGDYNGGVSAGVDAILAATGAESLAEDDAAAKVGKQRAFEMQKAVRAPPSGILGWISFILATLFKIAFFGIFVIIVIVLIIINMFGGGGGRRRSGGMFIGGFGGGGFGGGGGFSGGGGSFGGGGASGDW